MAAASELDAALLAAINPRWTKVAMVLARAAKAPGLMFDEAEDEYDLLAERLEQLADSGQVVVQGDLKQWRFSEVRLPNSDEGTS
jgi:hypothetical protein